MPAPARLAIAGLVAGYGDAPVLRDVDLDVAPGELVALLGPSGCGKTTLLRCVAGLERPTAGTISIGDQTVSEPGRSVAPERRGVGMVFQDGALFPHLTVAQNVAYSLGRSERRGPRVRELLEIVGLADFADRAPGTLSGGQQQRVAIARALAPNPRVLLLDEPFSSLDAALRVRIRTEVRRLLAEVDVTSVFVTHDREEAFALGHRVGVMRDGVLEQVGTAADIYSRPVSPFVAEFVGEANMLAGRARGTVVETAMGPVPLIEGLPSGTSATVLCRPEHLDLERADVERADVERGGSDGGAARVEVVEYYGRDTRCEVRLANGEVVIVRLAGAVPHAPGDTVRVRHRGQPTVAWAEGATPNDPVTETDDVALLEAK
jgi:iron(III) transport system ATP-binding protein